jgi:hypothetical protein
LSLHNKDGEVLYKRMFFKVIIGKKTIPFEYVAPGGRLEGFPPEAIEKQLEAVIEHIDKSFPKLEFRQVQILPNRYSFICTGYRKDVSDESKQEDANKALFEGCSAEGAVRQDDAGLRGESGQAVSTSGSDDTGAVSGASDDGGGIADNVQVSRPQDRPAGDRSGDDENI